MPIDWAVILADNIVGYILDQSSIGEAIRSKLSPDPERRAFKCALTQAFEYFEQQHPEADALLFNLDFLKKEGGDIIEQFLLRDGKPNPGELARRWADSLNMQHTGQRTVRVRELERIAVDFVDMLNRCLMAEPGLKEINDSRAFERTASNISALSTSFESFLHKLDTNKSTPGTLYDYLHWLIERNLYLDPRGILQTQRSVQVKLDEVYISLRAQHDEASNTVDRRVLEKELAELEHTLISTHRPTEELEDLREHLLARYNSNLVPLKDSEGEILDLDEVVARHEKVVILGDPGSGKTTLLRYLALKHAQVIQANHISTASDSSTTRFPILVRIADYAEYGLPKGKSLSDFLVDYYSLHECPTDGLADLLTLKLTEGNCFLLLDGLDEIVNTDERRIVVRQVEEFVRRYDEKGNRFIITSRIAGYRSTPLGEHFAQYTVQEMDETQIHHFLERWCTAVEVAQAPHLSIETRENTARNEVEGIMKAVRYSQGVRRLAANPLLLRILALIHRTGAQLPQKRIELYRLTAETLARTWRMSQGIAESALVKDEYLTPLLSKLAYWLHTNKSTGIATEREVYDVLGEEWASIHDIEWDLEKPNAKIKEDIKSFLIAVREHTGLFVERAPKRYGFMHLTFEEYYAARYLVARSRTRARLVRDHLHDPHWNEPILLSLGFVGMESLKESIELLETAILARGKDALFFGFTPSLYEDILCRDYLFALRCLGDGIPIRPLLIQQLLKRLTDEWLHHTGSARFLRYQQALQKRLEHLSTGECASALSTLFLEASPNANFEERLRIVEGLKRLGQALPYKLQEEGLLGLNDEKKNVFLAQNVYDVEQRSTKVFETTFTSLHQDVDSLMRQILGLGKSGKGSTEDIAFLLRMLRESEDLGIRQAALWSLGRADQSIPDVITALLNGLQDSDPRIRYTAIASLNVLGITSSEVVTALFNALNDMDARVRQDAIQSLAKLEPSRAEVIPALQNVLKQDSSDTVRYVAAVQLGMLERMSNDIVPILLQALQDAKSWTVRRDAARLLGEHAQSDDTIIEILWQKLLDDDKEVRTSCIEALAQIGRRFPETSTFIAEKLVKAIEDPKFDKPDNVQLRSAQEYAFNGLWLMVVSGEVISEI